MNLLELGDKVNAALITVRSIDAEVIVHVGGDCFALETAGLDETCAGPQVFRIMVEEDEEIPAPESFPDYHASGSHMHTMAVEEKRQRKLARQRRRVKTLAEMADEVHAVNVEKGWFDDTRTFGDGIALLHSEASEALEAFRDHGLTDATKPAVTMEDSRRHHSIAHGFCNHGELPGQCPAGLVKDPPKPEGVGGEYADVLIRLLDNCKRDGIDLEFEYERKLAYNRTRPHRHGGRSL